MGYLNEDGLATLVGKIKGQVVQLTSAEYDQIPAETKNSDDKLYLVEDQNFGLDIDSEPVANSKNPVASGGVYAYTSKIGSGSLTTTAKTIIPAINELDAAIDEMSSVFINVKSFGVTGNGSTDDTTNIQSALNSGAGMYYFPKGTYIVSSTINLPENVSIVGDGMASEIKTKSSSADIIKLTGSNHVIRDILISNSVSRDENSYAINTDQSSYGENIVLENVNIFKASNTLATGGGIYISSKSKIWMVNGLKIEMRGPGTGIRITGGNDRFFNNCWLRGSYIVAPSLTNSGTGVRIDASAGDFFQNMDIVQFNYDLLMTTTSGDVQAVKFSQCMFDSSRRHCVNIYNDKSKLMHCVTFNGCWFGSAGYNEANPSDANGAAIVNYTSGTTRGISFNACMFHSNKCNGIYILNSSGNMDGVSVTNSLFEGNGTSSATEYKDILISNINSCIVSGNMFNRHSTPKTVNNVEINNYTVVTNNIFHSTGDNIKQNGSNNSIANNVNH